MFLPPSTKDLDADTLRTTVVDAVGLTTEGWNEAKDILSGCVYEQKWTDLTIDQLCNQVRVMVRGTAETSWLLSH